MTTSGQQERLTNLYGVPRQAQSDVVDPDFSGGPRARLRRDDPDRDRVRTDCISLRGLVGCDELSIRTKI
jgi:hypothetical protein